MYVAFWCYLLLNIPLGFFFQKNPEGIMKAYCKEIGIEFSEKMLKWADDGDSIMQKWMICKENAMLLGQNGRGDIHKNAFESTGFGQPSELPDKNEMDEDVLEVADQCMLYYEKLLKAKLQAE